MAEDPGRSERPEQESGVSEASAERRAPQASQERRAGSDSPALQEQSPEAGRSRGDKPSTPQEFYWLYPRKMLSGRSGALASVQGRQYPGRREPALESG